MTLPRRGERSWERFAPSWLTDSLVPEVHLPQVAVDLGSNLPAWALRIASAVAATACTLLVASSTAHLVLAGVLIVTMVVRPSGVAPSLLAVGLGLVVLASEADPFDPRVFFLALGLHLTVQLATVVEDLPWTATVELRILAAPARPFLAIQAFVQVVGLVGAWTTSRQVSVAWLPVVAGIALAVLAWGIALRLRTER